MIKQLHEGLQALGASANTNEQMYAEAQKKDGFALLERFPSPSKVHGLNVHGAHLRLDIETNEFTSLCPMTGQPDFAKIIINYTPNEWCVESKSLKLYFLSFRNKGEFHESVITRICNDLVELLKPSDIVVKGEFTPRGGISFWPTATYIAPVAKNLS
jgi:7-cyano-7-deazaguanine reductase